MTDAVREALEYLRRREGVHDVSHVELFDVYLDSEPGQFRRVRVEVHDYGPDAPPMRRYRAVAFDQDGHRRTASTAESVSVALAILHLPEGD